MANASRRSLSTLWNTTLSQQLGNDNVINLDTMYGHKPNESFDDTSKPTPYDDDDRIDDDLDAISSKDVTDSNKLNDDLDGIQTKDALEDNRINDDINGMQKGNDEIEGIQSKNAPLQMDNMLKDHILQREALENMMMAGDSTTDSKTLANYDINGNSAKNDDEQDNQNIFSKIKHKLDQLSDNSQYRNDQKGELLQSFPISSHDLLGKSPISRTAGIIMQKPVSLNANVDKFSMMSDISSWAGNDMNDDSATGATHPPGFDNGNTLRGYGIGGTSGSNIGERKFDETIPKIKLKGEENKNTSQPEKVHRKHHVRKHSHMHTQCRDKIHFANCTENQAINDSSAALKGIVTISVLSKENNTSNERPGNSTSGDSDSNDLDDSSPPLTNGSSNIKGSNFSKSFNDEIDYLANVIMHDMSRVHHSKQWIDSQNNTNGAVNLTSENQNCFQVNPVDDNTTLYKNNEQPDECILKLIQKEKNVDAVNLTSADKNCFQINSSGSLNGETKDCILQVKKDDGEVNVNESLSGVPDLNDDAVATFITDFISSDEADESANGTPENGNREINETSLIKNSVVTMNNSEDKNVTQHHESAALVDNKSIHNDNEESGRNESALVDNKSIHNDNEESGRNETEDNSFVVSINISDENGTITEDSNTINETVNLFAPQNTTSKKADSLVTVTYNNAQENATSLNSNNGTYKQSPYMITRRSNTTINDFTKSLLVHNKSGVNDVVDFKAQNITTPQENKNISVDSANSSNHDNSSARSDLQPAHNFTQMNELLDGIKLEARFHSKPIWHEVTPADIIDELDKIESSFLSKSTLERGDDLMDSHGVGKTSKRQWTDLQKLRFNRMDKLIKESLLQRVALENEMMKNNISPVQRTALENEMLGNNVIPDLSTLTEHDINIAGKASVKNDEEENRYSKFQERLDGLLDQVRSSAFARKQRIQLPGDFNVLHQRDVNSALSFKKAPPKNHVTIAVRLNHHDAGTSEHHDNPLKTTQVKNHIFTKGLKTTNEMIKYLSKKVKSLNKASKMLASVRHNIKAINTSQTSDDESLSAITREKKLKNSLHVALTDYMDSLRREITDKNIDKKTYSYLNINNTLEGRSDFEIRENEERNSLNRSQIVQTSREGTSNTNEGLKSFSTLNSTKLENEGNTTNSIEIPDDIQSHTQNKMAKEYAVINNKPQILAIKMGGLEDDPPQNERNIFNTSRALVDILDLNEALSNIIKVVKNSGNKFSPEKMFLVRSILKSMNNFYSEIENENVESIGQSITNSSSIHNKSDVEIRGILKSNILKKSDKKRKITVLRQSIIRFNQIDKMIKDHLLQRTALENEIRRGNLVPDITTLSDYDLSSNRNSLQKQQHERASSIQQKLDNLLDHAMYPMEQRKEVIQMDPSIKHLFKNKHNATKRLLDDIVDFNDQVLENMTANNYTEVENTTARRTGSKYLAKMSRAISIHKRLKHAFQIPKKKPMQRNIGRNYNIHPTQIDSNINSTRREIAGRIMNARILELLGAARKRLKDLPKTVSNKTKQPNVSRRDEFVKQIMTSMNDLYSEMNNLLLFNDDHKINTTSNKNERNVAIEARKDDTSTNVNYQKINESNNQESEITGQDQNINDTKKRLNSDGADSAKYGNDGNENVENKERTDSAQDEGKNTHLEVGSAIYNTSHNSKKTTVDNIDNSHNPIKISSVGHNENNIKLGSSKRIPTLVKNSGTLDANHHTNNNTLDTSIHHITTRVPMEENSPRTDDKNNLLHVEKENEFAKNIDRYFSSKHVIVRDEENENSGEFRWKSNRKRQHGLHIIDPDALAIRRFQVLH